MSGQGSNDIKSYALSENTGSLNSPAMEKIPFNVFLEYTAPVGLLGLMTTMALVLGLIFFRMLSKSGSQAPAQS